MEKYFFEKPTINRKNDLLDYFNEFVKYNSQINGACSLDKVLDGYTFEEALEMCNNMEDEQYALSIGKCPSKTFLLIRQSDNRVIGNITIRWNLNEKMKAFAGHIGYSIRPTERRKGLSKINLYLGLKEAYNLGLDKVILSCNVSNLGSDKTIKALGGILQRCEIDPYDNELTNVYFIDVLDSLNKYKDIYEPNIDTLIK